jgi:CHAD domain-containing protein
VDRTEEHEAKFDVPAGTVLPDLAGVAEGLSVLEVPELRLVATYFDTPGLRLLHRNVTVRHRRATTTVVGAEAPEGGQGLWTLKLPDRAGKATFARAELSWPGPGEAMPTELADLVRGLALGQSLAPVAEIVTLRRRIGLRDGAGTRRAEVADDEVTITTPGAPDAPGAVTAFRQVEVELDVDDDDLLDRIAKRLETVGIRRGQDEPKLARALLGSADGPHAVADTADGRAGGGADGAATVVAASLAGGLEALISQDPGVRLGDDPEFVHQARVAVRRLRSDLDSFAGVLDPAWVSHTRGELKWLAGPLGEVRDADVLAQRLAAHGRQAAAADAAAFDTLAALLADQRSAALRRLRAALASARYIQLLRNLDHAVTAPPLAPAGPAAPTPATVVWDRWRKLRRAVERLDDAPSDDALHAIRIRAKQVRYAADAAIPAVGEPARRLATGLATIQTVLGDYHDAVVAEAWFRAASASSIDAAFAAGQCVTLERLRQRTERQRWGEAWKHLADKHPRP